MTANTVFLRLEGPMQSWGLTSRFVIRDTGLEPSKSGVIGLICCARGLRRAQAEAELRALASLRMGVRVDRPGTLIEDYHTVGARYGVMSAEGKRKKTQSTGEYEALISRRSYLCDASFLVALQGESVTVDEVARALHNPKWPPFLGRKSCPPALPIFAGLGYFHGLAAALASASHPWQPRLKLVDQQPSALRCILEATAPYPANVLSRQDVPESFLPPVHRVRYVIEEKLPVTIGEPTQTPVPPPLRNWPNYEGQHWKGSRVQKGMREKRLRKDFGLCVFCKQPAEPVHHVTYIHSPDQEELQDLRSLCRLCHDAVTMLEYGHGMTLERINPCDPVWRGPIQDQREAILQDRIPHRLRHQED